MDHKQQPKYCVMQMYSAGNKDILCTCIYMQSLGERGSESLLHFALPRITENLFSCLNHLRPPLYLYHSTDPKTSFKCRNIQKPSFQSHFPVSHEQYSVWPPVNKERPFCSLYRQRTVLWIPFRLLELFEHVWL